MAFRAVADKRDPDLQKISPITLTRSRATLLEARRVLISRSVVATLNSNEALEGLGYHLVQEKNEKTQQTIPVVLEHAVFNVQTMSSTVFWNGRFLSIEKGVVVEPDEAPRPGAYHAQGGGGGGIV